MSYDALANINTGDLVTAEWLNQIQSNFASILVSAVNVVFDGGGAAVSTGSYMDVAVPFKCNITGAHLLLGTEPTSDQRVCITVWCENPTSDHICTSDDYLASSDNMLICSTATGAYGSNALTNWTVAIAANSVMRFHVDDWDGFTGKATAVLELTRSS